MYENLATGLHPILALLTLVPCLLSVLGPAVERRRPERRVQRHRGRPGARRQVGPLGRGEGVQGAQGRQRGRQQSQDVRLFSSRRQHKVRELRENDSIPSEL